MGITKGEWECFGSLILAFGKDGAVICELAEPHPESGLTEFLPMEIGSKGWELQQANARLIVTACNACQKVNPDNPQAVAESIEKAFEHLQVMCNSAERMSCWDKMPNDAYYKAKRFLDEIKQKGAN